MKVFNNVILGDNITPQKINLQIPNEPQEIQGDIIVLSSSNLFLPENDYREIKSLDLELLIADTVNWSFQVFQGNIVNVTDNTYWIFYYGMVTLYDSYYLCCINLAQTIMEGFNYTQLPRIELFPVSAGN